MKISRVSEASPCCAVVKASSWPPHLTPPSLELPVLLEVSPASAVALPAVPLEDPEEAADVAAASDIVDGLNLTLTPVYLWWQCRV